MRAFNAQKLEDKEPISVVFVKTRDSLVSIYAVVHSYGHVLPIKETVGENTITVFGFTYYKYHVNIDEGDEMMGHTSWEDIAPTVTEIGCGLLLPLLAGGAASRHLFALISSNWKTM